MPCRAKGRHGGCDIVMPWAGIGVVFGIREQKLFLHNQILFSQKQGHAIYAAAFIGNKFFISPL